MDMMCNVTSAATSSCNSLRRASTRFEPPRLAIRSARVIERKRATSSATAHLPARSTKIGVLMVESKSRKSARIGDGRVILSLFARRWMEEGFRRARTSCSYE
eukprot:scaffold7017_cov113-Isochrysis_galbana.AAC.2